MAKNEGFSEDFHVGKLEPNPGDGEKPRALSKSAILVGAAVVGSMVVYETIKRYAQRNAEGEGWSNND